MYYFKIHDLKYCKEHFYEDGSGDFWVNKQEYVEFNSATRKQSRTFKWIRRKLTDTVVTVVSTTDQGMAKKYKPFIEKEILPETYPEYFL